MEFYQQKVREVVVELEEVEIINQGQQVLEMEEVVEEQLVEEIIMEAQEEVAMEVLVVLEHLYLLVDMEELVEVHMVQKI